MVKLTTEEFIKNAKKVHGESYLYDKVEYIGANKKVEIICPNHGPFFMTPSNHVNNSQGCSKCRDKNNGDKKRKNNTKFLKDLEKKERSENYTIDDLNFKTRKDKVKAKCRKHGLYETTPRDMLRSRFFGCKKCKKDEYRISNEVFLDKANSIHNDEYLYDEYKTSHESINAFCETHGAFKIKPYIHLKGMQPCPKCYGFKSKQERDVYNWLIKNIAKVEPNYRKLKNITELDFLLKDKAIAIELNGLFWHSEDKKGKFYHKEKSDECEKNNIRLIHIFEDEWRDKKDICKSIILSALGIFEERIFARKCYIKQISPKEGKDFLEENHIQGSINASVRLGLFNGDSLIQVMTFGKKRKCLGSIHKDGDWELYRLASKKNMLVVGGASKLLSFFEKTYRPSSITSYCDKRWFSGNGYKKIGFKKERDTSLNYFYTRGSDRINRFKFRKDILVKEGYDPNKTEKQIMKERGYFRIYDVGSIKFTKTYI